MALWELDEFAPPQFLGFVRAVPVPNDFIGTRWLPDQTVDDISFEYILGGYNRPVMAHVMGFDSEAPIHGRPGAGARVTGELPPIKRKFRIGEKEIIRFLAPRVGSADQQQAVNQVYGWTGDLLDAIQARAEWLRMQALSEDTIVYNEGGVSFAFDFGIDNNLQIDLSNETDGNGTSVSAEFSTVWTDTVNADPIADLGKMQTRSITETGRRFGEIVMSETILPYLYANQKMLLAIRGSNAPTALLSPQEVNQLLNMYGLPSITTYDTLVQAEQADGTYVNVRPMSTKKAFLIPEGGNIGNTLWGPTAESRVLLGTPLAAQAAGVWANLYKTDEPPTEWIKAAAVAFPSMPGANQIGQMKLTA
jgi:hypothetical protein